MGDAERITSDNEKIALIGLVKANENLWNTSMKDHHEHEKVTNTWNLIGSHLGHSGIRVTDNI